MRSGGLAVSGAEAAPRRLALFALVYAGSAAFQKGIGFVIFMVLAHSLSVEEYAKFGLLYALQAGVAGLTGAGVVESVIGLLRRQRANGGAESLFSAGNSVFLLQAGFCMALTVVVAFVFPRLFAVSPAFLFVIAASGIGMAFAVLQSQWARLEEEHLLSTNFGLFPPLAGWVIGFACFLASGSVESFFIGVLVGVLLALIAFCALGAGSYTFAFGAREIRPILDTIAPFVVVVLIMWISGYGNAYIVDAVFTHVEVARFTFLYTIAAIMQIVATSLNQVWMPRFLKILGEIPHDEVERRSRAFFLLQGVALGVAGALIMLLLPLATSRLGGNFAAYHDVNDMLFFLLGAYAVSIPWYHAQNYFFAHGHGQSLLGVTVKSSILGLAIWLPLMLWLGEIGVYAGFMCFVGVRTLAIVLRARAEWKLGMRLECVAVALALMLLGKFVSSLVYPA